MHRRILTDKEMKLVVKLRQTGSSWLRIQKETNVPRRSAQRAYEEWERKKSGEELLKARIDVAAEEFRRHLDDLIAVAQMLIEKLHIPSPLDEIDNADQFLELCWERAIYQDGTKYGDKEKQRLIRRNKLLFESLKQHTREKVHWQVLDEWKKALNGYIRHLKDLRIEASEILDNILNQRKGVRDNLAKLDNGKEIENEIVKGVVEAIWRSIIIKEPNLKDVVIQSRQLPDNTTDVLFGKNVSLTLIKFTDHNLAEEVVKVCIWTADNLRKGEKSSLIEAMAKDITCMDEIYFKLDGMLDELILRPIILHTRCDLCPV